MVTLSSFTDMIDEMMAKDVTNYLKHIILILNACCLIKKDEGKSKESAHNIMRARHILARYYLRYIIHMETFQLDPVNQDLYLKNRATELRYLIEFEIKKLSGFVKNPREVFFPQRIKDSIVYNGMIEGLYQKILIFDANLRY